MSRLLIAALAGAMLLVSAPVLACPGKSDCPCQHGKVEDKAAPACDCKSGKKCDCKPGECKCGEKAKPDEKKAPEQPKDPKKASRDARGGFPV